MNLCVALKLSRYCEGLNSCKVELSQCQYTTRRSRPPSAAAERERSITFAMRLEYLPDGSLDGTPQPATVLAIDFVGRTEVLAISSLNDKNHGGALALPCEAHEFLQMPRVAFANRIGDMARC
jgi:hypothetical protein